MLNLKSIKKDYVTASETVHALKGVSIAFRKSEFVSILGPSGCGKTTLLNIIGGLDHYTDGDLVIGGKSTKGFSDRDWDVYRNHRIGFIFQSYNLIPHQTVLGNVELALTIAGISKEARIARAKEALDRVGLAGQYYKKPNQLSGGQCQRVAIARALVNDPEILLADEPTGALDTVTSVQIMDLIKDISRERLVIMVTHNPELAEQYSSRIVRLRDGEVTEDTNPFSEEDEAAEIAAIREAEAIEAAADAEKSGKAAPVKREKAKMSFATAFMLSLKNLLSKKGRTAMVGFAGSIGIIGIAMVLAFSAGIKGYIASMQDDMLSGNPITITETAYDINVITDMINQSMEDETVKEPLKAYVSSMIEYISKMSEISDSFFIKNELTKDYMDYVKAMPAEYYNAMVFGYGIDFNHSIYTSFTHIDENGNEVVSKISVSALTNIYTSVLKETAYESYASYITEIAPSFQQAPNDPDYIATQYDVYGEIADEYDEIMIVLNSNQELSDILLARLGYYTEAEFYNLIYKVAHAGEDELKGLHNPDLDVDYFDYDELISSDHTFTWYPNDDIYVYNSDTEITIPGKDTVMNNTPFKYNNDASAISGEGVELRVTGVLIANDTTSYGCLSSGIYYTEALTNYVLEANRESEIVEYVNEHGTITSMSYGGTNMGIFYSYDYSPIIPEYDENGKRIMHTDTAFIGSSLSTSDILGSMGSMSGGSGMGSTGGMGGMGTSMLATMKTVDARMLGGVDVANEVKIYPLNFDSKDLVTSYLDKWNGEESLTLGDKEFSDEDRGNVTYTDALEIIIGMLNTMIDVVSYALIAFTSISLVVSTVMIGIITYVSVVERIKEIGVIRALGGRKKDVSHLFNAETFIIGLLAGLIGVGATYLISIVVNAILRPLIGYANIAALPISQAVLLVCVSILLTLISGLIPASGAAKKDPVVALRTE